MNLNLLFNDARTGGKVKQGREGRGGWEGWDALNTPQSSNSGSWLIGSRGKQLYLQDKCYKLHVMK